MKFFKPEKYFWKILSTIGVVSIVFQLITLSTLAYFVLIPLGQRATADLASVMIQTANTWQALSPSRRSAYVEETKNQHNLRVAHADRSLADSSSLLPYFYFLQLSLHRKLGRNISIKQSVTEEGNTWFWVDIPVSDEAVRIGFERSRIGVNPPAALILLLFIGFYLTVISAIILTRRLTVPIERLYQAAQELGKGHWPEPVEIDGPEELAVLACEFNRMNTRVRALLSNRTTLLAGISHDLRTPLTQIQLALVMLPDDGGDSELITVFKVILKPLTI